MKRFNLVIPDETYNSLEEIAQTQETSKTAIIKQYIELGLMVEEPGALHLIRTEDGKLSKVMFA